jgi:hypothetical protein
MTDTTLTPSRLWKNMTPEQRLRAARAFWQDEEAADDQTQAMLLIAMRKKFRPKTVVGLDVDRKARLLGSLLTVPENLAGRALIVYHLAEHRPMMGRFLDAVGIEHEDGLIMGENVKPDAAKIGPAASLLADQFAAEDVKLYLNTLLCQDPEAWATLKDVPQLAGERGDAATSVTRDTTASSRGG